MLSERDASGRPASSLPSCAVSLLVLGFATFVWLLPEQADRARSQRRRNRGADRRHLARHRCARTACLRPRQAAAHHRRQSGHHDRRDRPPSRRLRPLLNCCVDLDYSALNTLGNAVQARRWAIEHGFHSLIVVTSAYHMPRALAELAHQLPDAALIPFPSSPTACASSRGGRTARPPDWCCRNISNTFSPRCACGSTPVADNGGGERCPSRAGHSGACAPAQQVHPVSQFTLCSVRSVALQRAVLCELDRSHDRRAADACAAVSDPARLHTLLCAHEPLAVAGRLRHQSRMARARKDSATGLHRRLQAPIAVGDICAIRRPCRSDLHPQARTDVDSLVRLVHVESRHDPGRPQRRTGGTGAHDGAGARSARTPAPARHFPGRHAATAGCRAELQAGRRPCSTPRPASPACRWRSIPDCSGRAGRCCVFQAPFWSKSSIRLRPASTRQTFRARLESAMEAASKRLGAEVGDQRHQVAS